MGNIGLMSRTLEQDIILLLLDGINIKLTDGLKEPYNSLVSAGYANYSNNVISKNWKTSWWNEPVDNPIKNRWEILDL